MEWLADGNVLVALMIDTHVHHRRAHRWFQRLERKDRLATCASTQGTLLRVHMKVATDPSAPAAWAALAQITTHPRHQWWGDDLPFTSVPHRDLQGSAQVTDAWLAELARAKGGRVATLDAPFAGLHAETVTLLPS